MGPMGKHLALLLAVVSPSVASSSVGAPPEPMPQSPIVLELFTSPGCSTCPAAERLLSRLGRQLGRRVVPLEFHVDYWNQGGWFDPLSARDWTERQAAYDRALGKGMYTPQLVVNGTAHFPGGDEPRARAEIASRREGSGAARISVAARKGEGGQPALTVAVTAEVTERVEARKLEILVALFENHVVTGVESGENRVRRWRTTSSCVASSARSRSSRRSGRGGSGRSPSSSVPNGRRRAWASPPSSRTRPR
jgi:hypothetical protein